MFKFISRNKALIALAAVALASFLWMTSQVRQPGSPSVIERGIGAAGHPAATAVGKVTGAIRGVWEGYFYLHGLVGENKRLETANDRLKTENTLLKEALAEKARVSELCPLKQELGFTTTAARVVGRDASSWFRSVWVDAGEDDGVTKDMPAAVYCGVVGKVTKLYGSTSRVMLITDPRSAVSCLTERAREPGILVGDREGLCRLQYVANHADVAVGDLVLTSGLDGIYPKGLPAGTVVKVNRAPGYFQEVTVEPTADLRRLEEVLVIRRGTEAPE